MAINPRASRLDARARIELIEQLQVLLSADLPILEALRVTHQLNDHPDRLQVVNCWRVSVEQGHGLAHGFRQLEAVFPSTVAAVVDAGEASGTLAEVLGALVRTQKAQLHAKEKLTGALAYPTTVLLVAALVSLGLLWGVVPQFEALFEDLNAPLPAPTVTIIHAAHVLKGMGWVDTLMALAVPVAAIAGHRFSVTVRGLIQTLAARVPGLGGLIRQQSLLHVAQGLSTLLKAGLPLASAVALVSQTTGHQHHQTALSDVHKQLRQGTALAQAMDQSGIFPGWMIQLIAVGERSGQTEAMFAQSAAMLQSDVNKLIDRSLKLVEPIMMVTVGLLVGGLLVGLYMPIFNLSSVMM